MSPDLAREIVTDSGIVQDELLPWSDYDHPSTDSYGRKLVINEGFFEIMVMSWVPGDVSAIHDHGYTLWGAVKVFGPAEHASFIISDGMLSTTSREILEVNRVLPVGHELVHQLGNTTENDRFLSLHIYGLYDPKFSLDSVTCNARVIDITHEKVQRSDGGMFFDLPDSQIKKLEDGPRPDFLSWSRNTVEYLRRIQRQNDPAKEGLHKKLIQSLYRVENYDWLERDLFRFVDHNGHMTQLHYMELLRNELKVLARFQREYEQLQNEGDHFQTYARLYDEVIGRPCLNDFIADYLKFAIEKYNLDVANSRILSIGCGTGIVEKYMIDHLGASRDRILGIDTSEAMVKEASRHIEAVRKDILHMETEPQWDIAFEGLNVFQYLHKPDMERAIAKTAAMTRPGGIFIGDFVTPDHIRWYPHVIRSENVISLRAPRIVEKDHNIHQESDILNVSRLNGDFRVTWEGKHLRYLPSLWKIRYIFKKTFKGSVDFYDAVSLKPLRTRDDTSPSTRVLVVARKE